MIVKTTVSKQVFIEFEMSKKDDSPVLISLHGAGERGMKPKDILESTMSMMDNSMKDHFNIVTPSCPEGTIWEKDAIMAMITNFFHFQSVSLIGYSMGGRGIWDFLCDYAHLVDAAIPICGYSCYLKAGYIASVKLPVLAIHGSDDEVVPVEETIKMVNEINRLGGKAKKVILTGAGHGAYIRVYSSSEVTEWLKNKTTSF